MTNTQNIEFTLRIAKNIKNLTDKNISVEAAKKSVFEELNAKFPLALAAWLKFNGK